ncbi:bifunctional acetate--CoA ligase family protein/GNAT family N-acetyltransferase [Streptomyces zagrosensis]|uniref:Acyl-CoA synthetase (NDP forming)/GNAT superfamily N-acetyltransferase n=1 Tax=Streptomyces zagrosensis TaxID=1042984 RepID=A0A7W9QEE1_9ACTN|nr:GNAT family N-acetyltransferase [Streptomyces zagrosensis]MBB5938409.1 acyl-CoA synthetase (NDP forming)/GNAT superfamily N-acetyltransferase [Streptomyces zagrosensis]
MSATTYAPQAHALLTDGRTIEIRAAHPEDHAMVLRLHEEMSSENVRLRFFSAGGQPAAPAADRACAPQRPGHRTLVAFLDSREHIVGVAEYATGADPGSAEVAVTVADDFHHQGVGTLLLEHLVHAAREDGVRQFTAVTLADNHAMLRVFADLGLRVSRRLAEGEVHCTIPLNEDEGYLTAVEQRGRTADAASLQPLLRPRSIAVVGAGRKPTSVGRAVLKNMRRAGFTGRLYAVNPHAHSIEHTPVYPDVTSLPHPIDLVVVTVPAAAVTTCAEECGRSGARALLVLTAGLDKRQAAELLSTCRQFGMRLVGPNCLGLANTDAAARMDATFAARRPLPGTAGVAVQSGGVGIALLSGLSRLGIGVSTFASLGDKYDVSGNDMLQWWEEDGVTDLAVLHLESFGNPRAFSRTARRLSRRMPVLTVDAGRSEAGRRAAASHTAAAATPTMTRQALFTQAGVIATRSVSELLDTVALLHAQPLPGAGEGLPRSPSGRVAIVSNAGGAGVLAADACVEAGLTVPELPAKLITDLASALPEGARLSNPIDTTATVGAAELGDCLDRLCASRAVDAVVVVLVPTALAAATGDDPLRALTDAADRHPLTLAVVLPEQEAAVRLLPVAEGGRVPAYADPRSAAHALAHAVRRARWLARPPGKVLAPTVTDLTTAERITASFLDEQPDEGRSGGWLSPAECAELLDCYGIPHLPWAWAGSEDEAVAAAARLAAEGGRVVLKAHWPGLVHKSKQGAVLLDLAGESAVRMAYRDLAGRFQGVLSGVLVQPMADRGLELFAGVVQDEVFGPLVLFGHGGTATELLADHAARLAPLTDQDVQDLITGPRCAPLLFGYGGGGAVDIAGLERLLVGLSQLACDLPQLAEIDLNPVLATPDCVTALDMRVRLLPRQARDPFLRQLR